MRIFNLILYLFLTSLIGCSQNKTQTNSKIEPSATDRKVGGTCEGCEAIYESPVPFDQLNSVDTLPDFNEDGPKIEISGYIFHSDGNTPAANVIMYLYHTDQNGIYSGGGNESIWGKRHGYIRGWLKTDSNGFYKFYTLIPASYPNTIIQKHIHPTIKEPGKTAYWIDDFVFDDDPFLIEKERNKKYPVAGSGVLVIRKEKGILKARRDIILGLNVKDY
ncbi:MAG: hypothetical protein ABIP79_17725 [Chitinophagaceae bacterium]